MKNNKVKLSDSAIEYIAKYIVNQIKISMPLTDDTLDEIFDLAFDFETELATKELNQNFEFNEERAKDSIKFVDEISSITLFDKEIDLIDLELRLKKVL